MEDPWANAWGEPSKSGLPSASTSSWSAPSVSLIQGDHEDDLSTPEWSIKPTTGWADPDIAETSLWGSDASAGWNPAPSTFDRISLASKDSTSEISATFVEPASQIPEASSVATSSPSPPPSVNEPLPATTSPPRSPSPGLVSKSHSLFVPPLSLPPVDDVDGFGTFETAVEDVKEWGTPPKPSFSLPSADALAWGTEPWEAPNSESQTSETRDEVDDEWETARQQKEKQDRHVPPELLAAILHQFAELSSDMWPESNPSDENQHSRERTVDMDSLGLNSIMQRLVPEDLVLPVNVPFSKTFVSKQLSEALKLTRHSHLTRSSPMALYMASKGSTSWEASLKAKPNIIQEDIVPAGWKILDSTKEDPVVADDGKKKPSGGLLSFFGRRATNSSADVKRSSSPISNSGISSGKPGGSPRASVDSARRSASQSVNGDRSTPSSPSVATFGSGIVEKNGSNSLPDIPATSNATPSDEIVREPSPPPPSAVSRFLGRFSSRPKTSSRESIALSSDDLEFLSDVPSLSSPEIDHSTGLDALSMMIKSPPLPTTLPAPLAPPPKAPPKPSTMSPALSRQPRNDDFMSFFDTLGDAPQGLTQSESPLSLLTAAPTPPVKATLISSSSASSPPIPPSSIPTVRLESPDRQSDQPWASFDYPSAPMNKPLPPQNKRSFVPIMSSSRPPSTAPPLLPKPGSFALLSPPPTGQRGAGNVDLLSGASNVISPLPPPPTSRPHTPHRQTHPVQPASQPVSIDDDDDFADFLSSPAQTTDPGLLSFNAFTPTQSEARPQTVNKAVTSNGSHEFDDFLGPLPPQPPAKSNSFASNTATSSTTSIKRRGSSPNPKEKPAGLVRKISRKADHSRTLSLLETAAARGRWLNPPSPLPEALQPPPNTKNASNMDLFDMGGSSMQTQQAQVIASLTTSYSTPAIPSSTSTETPWNFSSPMKAVPMHSTPGPQSSLSSAAKPQPTLLPSPMQNGNTPAPLNGAKPGGLSAQDLSFFEGL